MTHDQIISDAEIERVHGAANFGDQPKRAVVNEGVFKYAIGFHCGSTVRGILLAHGLITQPRGPAAASDLTAKGKRYARATYAHLATSFATYATKQQSAASH